MLILLPVPDPAVDPVESADTQNENDARIVQNVVQKCTIDWRTKSMSVRRNDTALG